MKKILFLNLLILLFGASFLFAGTTLRYYNKDSSSHTFNVKTCGNSRKVTFGGSRTASVTIQGCSDATIFTKCGNVKVKNGDKIEIKNGCIKIK